MTEGKTDAELADLLDARLEKDRNGKPDPDLGLNIGPGLYEEISKAVDRLRSSPQAGAGVREALKPFVEAYESALISGKSPMTFVGADDFERLAKAALASPTAMPDREKMLAIVAQYMNCFLTVKDCEALTDTLLSAHQPVATEREAIIEECAKVADNLSDCSGPFIAEQIRALAQQPRSEGK